MTSSLRGPNTSPSSLGKSIGVRNAALACWGTTWCQAGRRRKPHWLHPSPGSERGNFVHISCQGAINLQEVMVCVFPGNMAPYPLLGLGLLQVSAVAIENSQHPLILLASPALLFICFLIKTFFVCVGLCLSTLNKHTSQTLIRKPAAARKEVGTVSPLR